MNEITLFDGWVITDPIGLVYGAIVIITLCASAIQLWRR